MHFEGKVVIVTGAGSGIGAASAIKFASLNARLALVDINENNLNHTLEQCGVGNHLVIVADLLKPEDALTVVPKTIKYFGRIDVLVNCAGVLTEESMTDEDTTIERNYDFVIGVNLKAPVLLTSQATPYLIESKGNIVNISSIRSSRPSHRRILYSVSKAGLEMFTKCVALDLANHGVRVNSVHPGAIKTNIWLSCDASANLDDITKQKTRALPFGFLEPEEVAKVIVFLANNKESKSITGSAYNVDGGISLMESIAVGGKF